MSSLNYKKINNWELWCMTHDALGSSPRGMIVGFGHDIKNTMNIEEHYIGDED
jgi:hypothetical protein